MPAAEAARPGPAPATRRARLRIGLVSDCYLPRLGGIELQVHALARELARLGHRVEVVTPTPGPREQEGVRVHRLRGHPIPRVDLAWTPAAYDHVRELVRPERFDVVHCHGGVVSPVAYYAAYVAQRAGIPTVVTTHSVQAYVAPALRLLDRWIGWSGWPVVLSAVSTVCAREIAALAPAVRPVLVLPNGLHCEHWAARPCAWPWPGPHLRHARRVRLLAVMRLARRKRPLALIRIFDAVRARLRPRVDVTLTIVGDGALRPAVERDIRRRGLERLVSLEGTLDQTAVRRKLAEAEVFVTPSRLEAFGIAALEARAAGVPVVAHAGTGIADFIVSGRNGLLARGDGDMVDLLASLAADPDLLWSISRNNATPPEDYDWARVVQANLAAYRAAIDLRDGASPAAGAGVTAA